LSRSKRASGTKRERKIERGTKGEQNGASLTGDSFHVKPENKLILFHFIAF